MIIAVFGESCTGKSTLTAKLKEMLSAEVYSGKDYLRLAKNEADAEMKFRNLLKETQAADSILIDVISEPEQLKLLPAGCLRVLVTADLEQIEARFAKRTGGVLPPPVAAMLQRKHGVFDAQPHDLHIHTSQTSPDEACKQILQTLWLQ